MAYVLGVDVGTTYTAAAVARAGRVEAVTLDGRRVAVPSVAYRVGDDVVVGTPAERRAAEDASRVAREFKRRVGDPTPILLGGAPFAPELLMARTVAWAADQVAGPEGGPPDRLAVTHPALWGDYKLDLLRQALARAGRPVDEFVAEPVAAATFYTSRHRLAAGSAVAVYDLGGGTFDAAVVRADEDGRVRIVGRPDGIERLGGIDFDQAVFAFVLGELGLDVDELDADDAATAAAIRRLRRDCVDAKEALSSETAVAVPVMVPGVRPEVRMTRGELEDRIRPALTETALALRRTVESAGDAAGDVTAVLLVGGSSRIPLVGQMVTAELGLPIAVDARPKDAIPMGAALVAARGLPAGAGPPGPLAVLLAPAPPLSSGGNTAPASTASGAGARRRLPLALGAMATCVVLAAGIVAAARGGEGPATADDRAEGAGGELEGELGSEPGGEQPVADVDLAGVDLAGVELTVGSLGWGEQDVLAHVAARALNGVGAAATVRRVSEDPGDYSGAQVNDRIHVGAGQAGQEALASGEADLYWDYRGQGTDGGADVAWLDPAGFAASRAVAVDGDVAVERGLTTVSSLTEAMAGSPDVSLCATGRLMDPGPADGVFELLGAYEADAVAPQTHVTSSVDDLYTQVDGGTCTAGVVSATDGRVEALGLTLLEDDRGYFGRYDGTVAVRADVLDAHPGIAAALAPVAAALDDEVVRHLDARVTVEGEDPAYVAEDWLHDRGLLTGGSQAAPVSGFGEGVQVVGQDVTPGRYIATDLGANCYWARQSDVTVTAGDTDGILANDNGHGQAIVDIREGDVAFRSDGCGRWAAYRPPVEPATTIGDGDWVVGEQVAAGTYRAAERPTEACFWEVGDDFSGDFDSVTAMDNRAPNTIGLDAGERFTTHGCGTWAHE